MTIRSDSRLYQYQCRNCGTVAVASTKAVYGDPWRCNLCHSPMKFLDVLPITTDEQRSWQRRGIVYNPGVGRDPQPGSLREIPEPKETL